MLDWGTAFTNWPAWRVAVVGVAYFAAIYTVGACAMLALMRALAARGLGRVIDPRPLPAGQHAREWRLSASSVLIFGVGLIVPWGLLQLGWAKLNPNASGWVIVLEVLALGLWNEVHFWVNHRLLHTRRLIRFHGAHHRSVVTTPWSTYSFHPVEALMLGSVILLPMLVHDFSFAALAALPVLSLLVNLIGHSNYDFFPHAGDTRLVAASRRHRSHHVRPRGNFGFATRFMDRLAGTSETNHTR